MECSLIPTLCVSIVRTSLYSCRKWILLGTPTKKVRETSRESCRLLTARRRKSENDGIFTETVSLLTKETAGWCDHSSDQLQQYGFGSLKQYQLRNCT